MAMRKHDRIVGHVLRTISTLCHLFLSSGGMINCTVNSVRRYSTDLPQEGLEVPCKCNQAMIEEIRRLLSKRPKDPPFIVVKSSLVQKTIEKGTVEKLHETVVEGTVKKPRLEKYIPPLDKSVAMHSSDLW